MSAGVIAAHYVDAPVGNSFTGTIFELSNVRTTQTSTARTAQTWDVHHPHVWQFVDYITDIRIAGDYELQIDGVVVATVNGVTAGQLAVVFAPVAPMEMSAGIHEFKVKLVSGASVQWYNRSDVNPSGTGLDLMGWHQWKELANGSGTIGTVRFRLEDSIKTSKMAPTNYSGGTFTGQTWDITFDVSVRLYGILKKFQASEPTGWTLKVNGNLEVPAVPKPGGEPAHAALVLTTPLVLAAGTHTFKIEGSGVRRVWFKSGAGGAPSGDAHTTAWGNWSESSANQVDATLFYELV